jgi:gliding motility-associated-like protein
MIVSMRERLCFILILAGLFPLTALAQYPSKKTAPRFTITERKGCAPLSFQVTYPGCSGGASCTARFDDGRPDLPFVDGDVITYPDAGDFTLRIIAEVDSLSDSIDIHVQPATPPLFEVYSCESGGVQVVITDTQYPEYIIDFQDGPEEYVAAGSTPHNHIYPGPLAPSVNVEVRGLHHDAPPPGNPTDNRASDNCPVNAIAANLYATTLNPAPIDELRVLDDGKTIELDIPTADLSVQYQLMKAPDNTATGFTPFQKVYNTNTAVITVLEPEKDFFCFRLDAVNACLGNFVSSNIICSINFDVVAQNNAVAFTIGTSNAGSPTNTLDRDGIPVSPVSPDGTVTCNTDYTYQATATYPDNTRSISMHKSVRTFSTDIPASVENISSAAGATSVDLEWLLPVGETATSYIIKESSNGQNHPLQTSPTTQFTDNDYVYPTDYQIIYTNNCGVRSEPGTVFSRPMLLTSTLARDNTVTLNWTDHFGWKAGVDHYEIYEDGQKIDEVPSTVLTYSIADDRVVQTHVYRIWAAPDPSAVPQIPYSLSNEVIVIKNPNLSYPAAFTPNKDGLNDNFKIFSLFTASFEFKIFNRWGEMMFMTEDLQSIGWDGSYKGNPMPEGTYVFTAKIVDDAGRSFDRSGTVVLLRKSEQ